MSRYQPYPAYKDSGVEWLGGGAGALGSDKTEAYRWLQWWGDPES
jgi:hypothetical protein